MFARRLALIGITIAIVGMIILVYFSPLKTRVIRALQSYGELYNNPWSYGIETLEISVPRTILVSDSLPITVSYSLEANFLPINHTIPISIEILGGNFDVVPNGVVSKVSYVNQKANFAWVIIPKKLGRQSLLLKFTGLSRELMNHLKTNEIISTRDIRDFGEFHPVQEEAVVYNIFVVDTFGIPSWLIAILGYIASFGGTALTFPWIYEQWQKHRERREREVSTTNKSDLARKGNSVKKRKR